MKPTQLLRLVLGTCLLPSLGLTVGLSIVIPPALAEAQTSHQTIQQPLSEDENEWPRSNPHSHPPAAGDRIPPAGHPSHSSPQSSVRAAEPENNGNDLPQIRHRFPLDAMDSVLEIRAQSDAFRELQIFDPAKEKDTFVFSLWHTLSRTPTSDFSVSLGLSQGYFILNDKGDNQESRLPPCSIHEYVSHRRGLSRFT